MDTFRDFVEEVLGPLSMLPALEIPITDAIGCRAAVDVAAERAVPAYREALIDGIAVRVADVRGASSATPVTLPMGSAVVAGTPAEPLPEGHCARIAIGGQLPLGADAIVGPDGYRIDDDKVLLERTPLAGEGYREPGTQFEQGDVLVSRGEIVGTVIVAGLALAGHPRVRVHPRPRVVVLTVGSELVAVGDEPGEVTAHDANGVMLSTTGTRLGAMCHRVGPIRDDSRTVSDTLEDQLVRADIIVTTGGIDSPDDVMRRELQSSGIARFDGPPLAPCNAYGIGLLGPENTPVIALPGEPTAALLAFHALVQPIIRALLGRLEPRMEAQLPLWDEPAGSRVIPGWYDDGSFAPIAVEQPSIRDLAAANAVAIQHRGAPAAEVVVWPN